MAVIIFVFLQIVIEEISKKTKTLTADIQQIKVLFVRVIGLEPTHLTAPDPKSGVSTNFTTPACDFRVQIYIFF